MKASGAAQHSSLPSAQRHAISPFSSRCPLGARREGLREETRACSPAASLSNDIRASCSRPPLGGRELRVRLPLGVLFVRPRTLAQPGPLLPCVPNVPL